MVVISSAIWFTSFTCNTDRQTDRQTDVTVIYVNTCDNWIADILNFIILHVPCTVTNQIQGLKYTYVHILAHRKQPQDGNGQYTYLHTARKQCIYRMHASCYVYTSKITSRELQVASYPGSSPEGAGV